MKKYSIFAFIALSLLSQRGFAVERTGKSAQKVRSGMVSVLFYDARKDVLDFVKMFERYRARGVVGIRAVLPPKSKGLTDALSFEDLRQLGGEHGWELASNGYTFLGIYDSWMDIARELILSKKLIEDSTGMPVYTYVSPTGKYPKFVDFMVRKIYGAAVTGDNGLISSNSDRFRLQVKRLPLPEEEMEKAVSTVADSGLWAIFRVDDPARARKNIEGLLKACRERGVKVVTIREGAERFWGAPPGYEKGLAWLLTGSTFLDYAGEGAKFEKWQKGLPLGWDVYSTADSLWPDTLRKGFGIDIPTLTHLRAHLTSNDTLILTHYFAVPPMSLALFRIYISMWSCEKMKNTYWTLRDLEKDLWWNNKEKKWIPEEVRNTFDVIVIGGLKPYSTYIYFPDSTSLELRIFSYDNLKRDMYFMYDDFTLLPTLRADSRKLKKLSRGMKPLSLPFNEVPGPVISDEKGRLYRLEISEEGKLRARRIEVTRKL